jgi:E3 ubiquitin-protein ligase RGLG
MGACGSTAQVQQASPGHAARFRTIQDRFESIQEVQEALRAAGLESSDVIVAIDFTKSNENTGAKSFGGALLGLLAAQ